MERRKIIPAKNARENIPLKRDYGAAKRVSIIYALPAGQGKKPPRGSQQYPMFYVPKITCYLGARRKLNRYFSVECAKRIRRVKKEFGYVLAAIEYVENVDLKASRLYQAQLANVRKMEEH